MPSEAAHDGVKTINLALQGGGAHGGFTWGVLDRLLEDERIVIEAVSGTSAGAMNGAILVEGYEDSGRDGARAALEAFWRRVSDGGALSPLKPSMLDRLGPTPWNMDFSPAFLAFDALSRTLSPYQLNPLNINPLRSVLEASVDVDHLHRCKKIKLFVSATNVRTGDMAVFSGDRISIDALLASACLPFLYRAVEIDGEAYWDGGYMANPALLPLVRDTVSPDIVIVQINPLHRSTVPTTAPEITDRINEISFNASVKRDMRLIALTGRLMDEGKLDGALFRRPNLHMIADAEAMANLGVSSKLNAEWPFLLHLKEIGRQAAAAWLDRNFARIGVDSTVEIEPNLF